MNVFAKVVAKVIDGRRTLCGPGAPIPFLYVEPGLYESADDCEGYTLKRLGKNSFEQIDESGWYLTGGDYLREWCAADLFVAASVANQHIITSLVTH
ncbi:hypothetical protein [Streptomyces sp. NPDC088727]|uniref:hypothetical protein n=1 Tax=Streptomyces sp. NPDC088727 TaxID=3365875 RepID=UPI0037F75721